MATINFFAEDISFKLRHPRKTKLWIQKVIKRQKKSLGTLNYIFCSGAYLLSINEIYLKHKTLTDIITFDHSESRGVIEGDIFISIEQVKENAEEQATSFDDELHRVLIHGVLHLLGFKDKSVAEKTMMRKKEDACLSLRSK